MKEQTKALKPCPLCGSKAKIRCESQHIGYADDFEAYSVSEAIDAWNTRTNARLIAAAPEMYELLRILTSIDEKVDEARFDDLILAVDEGRKLLARIDGEEDEA